jgi:molybdopterin molybdotransferase
MLELAEAQQRILEAIEPLPKELIRLSAGLGRIAAEPILSTVNLPAFDNSAVDGYAVRCTDLSDATAAAPVELALAGKIAAGDFFTGSLPPASCLGIFTGSPVPGGADAVVMQEDVVAPLLPAGRPSFRESIKPWENIRFQGEDVRAGAVLAAAGVRLNPGALGLLAACGLAEFAAIRRPRVAVLATGSELREPGETLLPGQIHESNRAMISALVIRAGGEPVVFPIVRDDLRSTVTSLERAFAECDVVVTAGGVSVGEYDFVKAAFTELGGEVEFWKIAMRPGKPFVFGRRQGKFLFGLPGNPVSALVTFVLLAGPALAKLGGTAEPALRRRPGILAEAMNNPGDRRHFVRVHCDAHAMVRLAGIQASHRLASLARANGLLEIGPGASLQAGSPVEVIDLD